MTASLMHHITGGTPATRQAIAQAEARQRQSVATDRVKAAVDMIYHALVAESRERPEETLFTLRVRGSRDVVNTTIALKLQALQAGDVDLIQDELQSLVRARVKSPTARVDVSRVYVSPRNDVLVVSVDISSGLRTLFMQDGENFAPR